MDYTKEIYNKNDILDAFEKKYKVSYKKEYDVKHLLWLKQELDNSKGSFEKREELVAKLLKKTNAKNSRYGLLFNPVINHLNGFSSNDYNEIMEVISIILEYTEKTLDYINRKRFIVTVPQISEMLDLTDNYINNNLTGYFDSFRILNTVRYVVKTYYPDMYDIDFINKNVFISRKSVSDFLLKHLKFTIYRVQIDLNMPDDKYKKLLEKFKTKKAYKQALSQAVEMVNSNNGDLTIIEKYAKDKRITRNNLPTIDINEKFVNAIFGGDLILKSESLIRSEIQRKARVELEALGEEGKIYLYKSINPKQVYDYINKKMTSIRFKFVGLEKYNKQLDKVEDKVIVRYVVDTSKIANMYVSKKVKKQESYLYSLDFKVHSYIVGDIKDEKEIKKKIQNYFYDILMKESFVVKKNKD